MPEQRLLGRGRDCEGRRGDGQVTDSFYSLIHPEPEYYKWFCQEVHGIGPEDLEEAASAYKDIDEVMANQSDLTKIVTTLEPIAVIKGG